MSRSCMEITTLVFSIILSIVTGIPALMASGLMIFYIILMEGRLHEDSQGHSSKDLFLGFFSNFMIAVPTVVFFIFSSILACGVSKRKSVLVLIYFIFGVLAEGGGLAGAICCNLLEGDKQFFLTLSYALIGYCVINIPFLMLVWLTYKKLKYSTNYQQCKGMENFFEFREKNLD